MLNKLYVIIALTLCSCSNTNKFDTAISRAIENCSSKDSCVIDINDIFMKDQWDMMYIFREGITNIAVSKTIGFDYSKDKDLSRLILFTKGNTIVYEQTEMFVDDVPYPTSMSTREVSIPKSQAKFYGYIGSSGNYVLKLISDKND